MAGPRQNANFKDLTPNDDKVKRTELIKHIKKHDAVFIREGGRHTIYQRGEYKTEIPRHNEIVDEMARKICKTSKFLS